MGIFDDLIQIGENGEIVYNQWIEWDHFLNQYLNGNYVLKKLDSRGQRLAISVSFNGTSFYSGWLLCPEGKIKNTTLFGGWIK